MNICCSKCVQEIDTDTVDACHVVILTRYGMVSVGGQNEAYSQVSNIPPALKMGLTENNSE